MQTVAAIAAIMDRMRYENHPVKIIRPRQLKSLDKGVIV